MINLNVTIVLITPEIAKEYLEKNTRNRPLSQATIKRYAKDMAEGRWIANSGESIKFDVYGKLIDGQHRLAAVIVSKVSIKMQVQTGIDQKAFEVLDTGKTRNADDVFNIEGIKNSRDVTSIIKGYHSFKNGQLARLRGGRHSLTNSQTLQEYYSNPEKYDEVARICDNCYRSLSKIIPTKLLGVMYLYFSEVDKAQADIFYKDLAKPFSINEVINKLKDAFAKDKIATKRMTENFKLALFIKTWNYFRMGKTPQRLRYDLDEKFPEAI